MPKSVSNSGELSDVPVNPSQQLYTRRTILSENINRTRFLREYEKRSNTQLSNGNHEDDEDDDAEFFNSMIKKNILKEETPQHRRVYTSKRKTSRLSENFWNIMKNFKQNLKQWQQEHKTTSSSPRAFRKKEPKSDYPFNFIESVNKDAFSKLERRPLDCCEINSTLRNIGENGGTSRRTFMQAAAFSFSNDVTVSPVLLSSQDKRLEKQIEEEEYYISENRLMDLCEQMDVQSPTTSLPRYPSPVASSILSPYPQFNSQLK